MACFLLLGTLSANCWANSLLGIDISSGDLYSISETTAALTLVGPTGVIGWGDIAFGPNGTLYGFTIGPEAALYTINPATAAVAEVGSLGLSMAEGGLTILPDGTAYAAYSDSTPADDLLSINLTTGAASVIAPISPGPHDINGLIYRSSDGNLIGLDGFGNSLVLINPTTGATSTLAALTPSVGALGGMTILNGVGYFVTAGSSEGGSDALYSFNPLTGTTTLIGSLGLGSADDGLSGLAALPATSAAPEPASLVLAGSALIALFLARIKGRRHRRRSSAL